MNFVNWILLLAFVLSRRLKTGPKMRKNFNLRYKYLFLSQKQLTKFISCRAQNGRKMGFLGPGGRFWGEYCALLLTYMALRKHFDSKAYKGYFPRCELGVNFRIGSSQNSAVEYTIGG